MADRPMLRIIAYDIVSNRTRRRVAEALVEKAARVQDSVFEARLSHAQAERLMRRLERMIDKGDKLRLYTVPDAMLQRCREQGGPQMTGAARYWLV